MAAAVVSGRHLRCPSSQRQRGRQQLQVACSLRSFLLPAVAAAAVTVTLRSVAAQRQQQQQQQRGGSGTGRAPPAPQRREAADTGLLGGSGSAGSGWQQAQQALRSIDLTLPLLQSKEEREARQLASTVGDIERRQYREAQLELRRWDQRLALRRRTLAELRALAQQHGISGRSKMRKRELVAALEAALGFAPQALEQRQQHGGGA